jgi:hypothetical protein
VVAALLEGGEAMSDIDIEAEMWDAYQRLNNRQRDWLLGEIGEGCYLRFGPIGIREEAITMPLIAGGKVTDLISWSARQPEKFSTLQGSDLLGADAFLDALEGDHALHVYSSPWSMLKAASKDEWISERLILPGAAVLNISASHGIFALLPELICEDRTHAEAIDAAIIRSGKQSPAIFWAENERAAV